MYSGGFQIATTIITNTAIIVIIVIIVITIIVIVTHLSDSLRLVSRATYPVSTNNLILKMKYVHTHTPQPDHNNCSIPISIQIGKVTIVCVHVCSIELDGIEINDDGRTAVGR